MRISDYYTPFPRQREFHESQARYRLFGGAAGPGKTMALLWETIRQANRYDGVDTLLLRRTYPELEDSLLREFRRSVPRALYRNYNDSKHVVTWKNGSTTRFGYCRNENDVYRYQGAEFFFIGFDELTHFTLKQWQFLTSRNRTNKKWMGDGAALPNMAGATNPGNIGHAWVKALWIDGKAPAGFERPELYKTTDYDFIRARLDDNPIYAHDEDYRAKLETLPKALRQAMLEGNWDIFAGQYYDIFEHGKHTAPRHEIVDESWWPHWISIDWGFQHPSAVYWHSKAEQRAPHFARVSTYREFCTEPGKGLSPRRLAQEIIDQTDERITEIFLSPDAFAHRTSEASIAEAMAVEFRAAGLPEPQPADDERVNGWQWMYQLLESQAWVISEACPKLIECLPTLVRDEPPDEEDVRKMDGDDPADAARYGLVHLSHQRGSEPLAERVRRKMAETEAVEKYEVCGKCGGEVGKCECHAAAKELLRVKDYTSYAIHAQQVETKERKGMHSFRPGRRRR